MILGTAGHVDHGKTSLVEVLTGINTDKLPEEKRRGMTIEPGFAHLTRSTGEVVGLVDVPGHEKFVKSMVAGAGGIDVVLFVIAADEGLMPQTREHLAICSLLGIKNGLIVLTKIDIAQTLGEEFISLIESDVRALTAGTFLEKSPIVRVSSKTREGIPALQTAIETLVSVAKKGANRHENRPLYFPIDRAFSVAGFGTIVTGVLHSGTITVGDELALSPKTELVRVRSIESHGKRLNTIGTGQRAALNISAQALPGRGDVLVRPHEYAAARRLDVSLTLLPDAKKPLGKRSVVTVLMGTKSHEAKVRLLQPLLEPGQSCFAQLLFDEAVASYPKQHCVLRVNNSAGAVTVGGAEVLILGAPKRRDDQLLKSFSSGNLATKVDCLLRDAGFRGLTLSQVALHLGVHENELKNSIDEQLASKKCILIGYIQHLAHGEKTSHLMSGFHWQRLLRKVNYFVQQFHDKNPSLPGIPKEELRQRLGLLHEKTFNKLLIESKTLVVEESTVRLTQREAPIGAELIHAAAASVLALLTQLGLGPPLASELATKLRLTDVALGQACALLLRENKVIKAGDFYFSREAIDALELKLRSHFETHETLSTQELKELVQQSRKFLIPIAEYFDREKITLRVGDVRRLRNK
jgi:selenocysteine-specific elongation factor